MLLVSMLVVATVPVLFVGYNLTSYNASTLSTDQLQLHLQICKSVASETALLLQSCSNLQAPLQKSLEMATDPGDPARLFADSRTRDLLNGVFRSNERIVNLRAVYLDGKGVEAGYRIDESGPVGGELRNAFYRCLGGASSYVSRPYYSDVTRQMVFVAGRPLSAGGKVQGALTVVFSLNDLHQSLHRIRLSGHTAFLVDNTGRVILHPEIQKVIDGVSVSGSPLQQELRKLRSHASSTITFVDPLSPNHQSMVGTVYALPETGVAGWGVVVQTPEDVVNVGIRNMRLQTLFWVMFSVVLAVLMSYLFSQRISIPIQILTQRTLAITEGRFGERTDIRPNNELGILAENFDLMSERLADHIERLKKAAEENRQLFLGAIRTLAAAIDAKDPYTRGHSERVTVCSMMIGREMGLSSVEVERLQVAALLHDVGKIGISDAILQKPQALTEAEYAIMKQHPELGADIMSQIPQLQDVVPGMRHHHESMDGQGYPNGLQGEEIPLPARIIGVADAFDAMTTDRPYQKGFLAEDALARIRSLAGRKFDPSVVEALCRAYEGGKIRLPNQEDIRKPRYIKST